MADELDGVINPELQVNLGDIVQINLINSGGAEHNIGLPDFEAISNSIAGKGNQTQLLFRADREGGLLTSAWHPDTARQGWKANWWWVTHNRQPKQLPPASLAILRMCWDPLATAAHKFLPSDW
jgi:hypothetical protein